MPGTSRDCQWRCGQELLPGERLDWDTGSIPLPSPVPVALPGSVQGSSGVCVCVHSTCPSALARSRSLEGMELQERKVMALNCSASYLCPSSGQFHSLLPPLLKQGKES